MNSKKEQAIVAYQQQKLSEAKRLLEKVVKQDRRDAESWLLLGIINGRLGKYAKAEQAFRQVIACLPNSAGAYNNLGLALEAQGKIDSAFKAFEQGLKVDASNIDTHYNLANSLISLGRAAEAIAHYEAVIKQHPEHYAALVNLGDVLQQQQNHIDAEQVLKKAIVVNPVGAEAYFNLGNVYKSLERSQEALQAYVKATELSPEYEEAWNNLANLYVLHGDRKKATEAYQQVLKLNPDNGPAYLFLASSLLRHGKLEEAIAVYEKALGHKNLQGLELDKIHSSYLFALNYSAGFSNKEIFEEHLDYAKKYKFCNIKPKITFQNSGDKNRKLRIGYVSPDLYQHSVAYFLEPVLVQHNKAEFEVYCYADVAKPDDTTRRLHRYTEQWRDIVGKSTGDVIEQVLEDKIDILVDLAGHTADNRLQVFAKKAAPVQIAYLGYPNTTGLSAIDYRLTDEWADPENQDQYYSEELLRLPKGFLCYRPPSETPDVRILPFNAAGSITFGSFNNLAKMVPEVVELWSRLLKAIPGSKLLIKNESLRETAAKEEYIKRFEYYGISSDQVELIGWLPDKDDHLRLYGRIDIGLDTFPYNGTTTTCEAMWMGVPVITLCGDRHAARVGNSLLRQVGLGEFIAHNVDEYIKLAEQLSNDIPRLRQIREGLRERMKKSPLCDEAGFTRQLEKAYREMWVNWCEKQSERIL